MDRCVELKGNNVVVHLLWAELEYDVKYGINKRVKMMGLDAELKKEFIYTDKDRDWLLRTIDTALGKVKGKLKCNLVHHGHIASDELLEIPMEYNLIFKFGVGEKWIGNSISLMNAIHAFVANFCLAEYFDMANPSVAEVIRAKADLNLLDAYTEATAVILEEIPKFIL